MGEAGAAHEAADRRWEDAAEEEELMDQSRHHFHFVKFPGGVEEKMKCSIPEDVCTLGQATPEELAYWYTAKTVGSFDVWLAANRRRKQMVEQLRKSDDLTRALHESFKGNTEQIEKPEWVEVKADPILWLQRQRSKKAETVPVVQYKDGQRHEIGRAFVEIEEKDGNIYTRVTIEAGSMSLKEMLTLPQTGFFSIG